MAIGVALIGPAQAQRSSRYDVVDESAVTRTLSFAAGGGRTLDVRNINGFIHVEGTNDSTVQMSIRKEIRAETREDLAEAQRDVRLDFAEGAASVGATVIDRSGHVCGERVERSRSGPRVGPPALQRALRLHDPRAARRGVCGSAPSTAATSSSTARTATSTSSNVNGLDRDAQGRRSGRAHTVNGRVKVTFTANPKQPSSFKTVNGNVDVSFLDGLAADFAMKTMNGGLFTDFERSRWPGQSRRPASAGMASSSIGPTNSRASASATAARRSRLKR